MKASELRSLISKEITWGESYCPKRGFLKRDGILLDVKGKNALVDLSGSTDWKWIPDMHGLKVKGEDDA